MGTCSVTLQSPGCSIQGRVPLDSCYVEPSKEKRHQHPLFLRLESLLRDCSALRVGLEKNFIEIEAGCHAAKILIYTDEAHNLADLAKSLSPESRTTVHPVSTPPETWLDEFPLVKNAAHLDAERQFQRILQLVRDSVPLFFHFRTAVASWSQTFTRGIWDRIGSTAVFKANGGDSSVYFDLTGPCLTIADDGTAKFLLGSA